MQINESTENYLERILMIGKKKPEVHSIDIALELGVTKASVSHAMKLLRENGYITMDADNVIQLTPSGREIAQSMYARHSLLAEFLMRLGVSEQTAYADACEMEHDISQETFDAICRHAGTRQE